MVVVSSGQRGRRRGGAGTAHTQSDFFAEWNHGFGVSWDWDGYGDRFGGRRWTLVVGATTESGRREQRNDWRMSCLVRA